jgi:hypothetical protein
MPLCYCLATGSHRGASSRAKLIAGALIAADWAEGFLQAIMLRADA